MDAAVTEPPRMLKWALALGIVIILNVFFFALGALALPAPQYSAYCPAQTGPAPQTESACDAADGSWVADPAGPAPESAKPAAPSGYCDLYAKCEQPFQAAVDAHALKAFALIVVLGIVALIIGLLPLGSSAISTGLSYGGALALVIGSISYWGSAGNWVRLAIAAVGLAALLYIGWRRFRDA